MTRPGQNEYDAYYERYVALVEETDIIRAMEDQLAELERLAAEIDEEKSLYSYAKGKWTIRQLVGHLTDGERIFAYRALRISRADETPIEGFEQDGYIEHSNFNAVGFGDLVAELILSRRANLMLFKNLSAEAWTRTGTASGVPVSVRAIAFIMVGHVRHHLKILRERYL